MTRRKGGYAPIARQAAERSKPQPWVWYEGVNEHTIHLTTGDRITVHQRIGMPGWFVSAHFLRLTDLPLKSEGFADARTEGLRVVSEVVEALRQELLGCRA